MTWNWTLLDAGHFRLDGGSMFGVVPKALWSKLVKPDSENRIPQACNCVLLEKDNKRVLLECGYGTGWTDHEVDMYAMDGRTIVDALHEHDIDPDTIDTVILTHLHFDHAAGVELIPNANVILQKQEWGDSNSGRSTMRKTFLKRFLDSIEPRMTLLDGSQELMDGIQVTNRVGHTWGLQTVEFQDELGTVCFVSDVMPTRNHVGLSYSMGYDMLPWDNMETKRALLTQACDERWRLVLYHESDTPVVTVEQDGKGRFCLIPV